MTLGGGYLDGVGERVSGIRGCGLGHEVAIRMRRHLKQLLPTYNMLATMVQTSNISGK